MGTEDPGRWDDNRGADPQGARFLDLLQNEAGHLATIYLVAPRATDCPNHFAMEGELLLEALPTVPPLALLVSPVYTMVPHKGWLTHVLGFMKNGLEQKHIFSYSMQGVDHNLAGCTLSPGH